SPTLAQTSAPAPATNDPVVAKVNGAEIHESDLKLAEEDVGPNIPAATPEAKREWLTNYLVDMTLLSQQAEAQKVQDEAEFKRRLAFMRQKALMESLLRDIGKTALTPEAMQTVYDEAVKQIADEQEVHARHILFRVPDPKNAKASKAAEDKAKAALARIKKGEDFATVAKELTEDPPGKTDGGDLGYFTKEQMVPEFSEKAFSMEKGQVSEPVKTAFGWHIIKVEDKRQRKPPKFDAVKDQIETFVTRKAQIELLNKLRQQAKIERDDKPTTAGKPAATPSGQPATAPEPKKN
ncbi:MAG: peptidylprolyl isomerase, partial [Rhodobacteraceae bacterium]|nr:peptidylprolyl isomerase [Paracoccaceae bacterium]